MNLNLNLFDENERQIVLKELEQMFGKSSYTLSGDEPSLKRILNSCLYQLGVEKNWSTGGSVHLNKQSDRDVSCVQIDNLPDLHIISALLALSNFDLLFLLSRHKDRQERLVEMRALYYEKKRQREEAQEMDDTTRKFTFLSST